MRSRDCLVCCGMSCGAEKQIIQAPIDCHGLIVSNVTWWIPPRRERRSWSPILQAITYNIRSLIMRAYYRTSQHFYIGSIFPFVYCTGAIADRFVLFVVVDARLPERRRSFSLVWCQLHVEECLPIKCYKIA